MRESLRELQRRVYRRSIVKDIGVIEAIDERLTEIRNPPEKQGLEWLRAVIDVHRRRRLCLQPLGHPVGLM